MNMFKRQATTCALDDAYIMYHTCLFEFMTNVWVCLSMAFDDPENCSVTKSIHSNIPSVYISLLILFSFSVPRQELADFENMSEGPKITVEGKHMRLRAT